MNYRQACAVESAARMNKNTSIFVIFLSTVGIDDKNLAPNIKALKSYPNIYFRNLELSEYIKNTPIEEWTQNGQIFTSKYIVSHLSDFLRFLSLYKFGGIFLDLDFIVLRNLEKFPPNFAGLESNDVINSAALSLTQNGIGHEIAGNCLR